MAWGVGWLWLGLVMVGVMPLHGGIVGCGLVRIMIFFFLVLFFYDHSVFVKVMDVIIFHCVHKFAFLCGMY